MGNSKGSGGEGGKEGGGLTVGSVRRSARQLRRPASKTLLFPAEKGVGTSEADSKAGKEEANLQDGCLISGALRRGTASCVTVWQTSPCWRVPPQRKVRETPRQKQDVWYCAKSQG